MSDFSTADHAFMARALHLARKGIYTTMPNPSVGCVLVRDGKVIGEGFTSPAGGPHGEINALRSVNGSAKGATAYVTLEPCAHYGRTPPCAKTLVEAGVVKVVAAMTDPNPRVSGGGFKILEDAGIETVSGLLEADARTLNQGFFKRMETGKPYVRCKMAMSVDGRTAMESGESQWITGSAARADVQQWRARSCAVVTGVDSIIHDDSSLTVRANELRIENPEAAAEKQPLRVVVDSTLRIPLDAKILSLPGTTLLAGVNPDQNKLKTLAEKGIEVMVLPANESGSVDLEALMTELARRDCNEVLLETGATLAGSAVEAGLVDELLIYMAPVLMGSDARPLFQLPFSKMAEKRPLAIEDIRAFGNDWRLICKPTD
ncbi:bifunctional diaminohydroxyphosphoribosylaminopyrimidine deaminase/5-amino-6-(5-phosphoribosylamino)uracil reductase RibD [Sansalvadorimonas verongulae]|uniref:bifunctional diaminohydroxyphosphoribosylaminopyrimidine deaminase/5-amino-6-(5-phosphoribosylamino)uracil reductase RibD n=1 Tax=Sansalvadorimonas verongulae TaxID=2172824 RepID=UPI0012BC03C5|nr:bifunctional diaminohydroxyphosphoribosylaminopyrimidine deaminase/5-amino-6-(5-phosphoribosylamino)uracil reductase RibD [Sansalvadorimonas verongulae]MTI14479.1 bifunctional diaminohydroxyphosphoribosylaminopyrimidine deaminase/5-amino-6-(5-phosphoribosylamino)uracil reductase RibD [Sansalvadorimonas verongulae]